MTEDEREAVVLERRLSLLESGQAALKDQLGALCSGQTAMDAKLDASFADMKKEFADGRKETTEWLVSLNRHVSALEAWRNYLGGAIAVAGTVGAAGLVWLKSKINVTVR